MMISDKVEKLLVWLLNLPFNFLQSGLPNRLWVSLPKPGIFSPIKVSFEAREGVNSPCLLLICYSLEIHTFITLWKGVQCVWGDIPCKGFGMRKVWCNLGESNVSCLQDVRENNIYSSLQWGKKSSFRSSWIFKNSTPLNMEQWEWGTIC